MKTREPAKTILIVEDNDDWRDILVLMLQRLGHRTLEAVTGVDGIYKAIGEHPDLILMDLSLPEMNGDDAMRELKLNALTRDIPVIVQTAHMTSQITERAIKAGAREILHKPIMVDELYRVFDKYLSTGGKAEDCHTEPQLQILEHGL
jgi:CheY-like chemotaxis protein